MDHLGLEKLGMITQLQSVPKGTSLPRQTQPARAIFSQPQLALISPANRHSAPTSRRQLLPAPSRASQQQLIAPPKVDPTSFSFLQPAPDTPRKSQRAPVSLNKTHQAPASPSQPQLAPSSGNQDTQPQSLLAIFRTPQSVKVSPN